MPLGGPEGAVDDCGRPMGIWVMAHGSVCLSVDLRAASIVADLKAHPEDQAEAHALARELGFTTIRPLGLVDGTLVAALS